MAYDLDLTHLPAPELSALTTIKAPNLASAAIQLLFVAAGLGAFFYLIFGGLSWMLAGGDKEGTAKAGMIIKNALIGLTIVLCIYAFGATLNLIFGIDMFSVCFPGPDTPSAFVCPSSGITGVNNGSGGSGGPTSIDNSGTDLLGGIYACPCFNGKCANQFTRPANGGGGVCYQCTSGGWSATGATDCGGVVIHCGTCQ